MEPIRGSNVKIYNLSAGKSLPEWLSEKKRKKLLKSDVELQRRIQLLQDFDMPSASHCVKMSKDGTYILATGVYKPRVKCFDVNEMALKFERCMDALVTKTLLLANDYTKMVFLQNDRFVELHDQQGRYFRLRLPRYGRDLAFYSPAAELLFVGVGNEIYRMSLERGQFMEPFKTQSSEMMCCTPNDYYEFLACGTKEGMVECWDLRTRSPANMLDCLRSGEFENNVPNITSIKFKDSIHMAVGTSTGHVLLYDLRSSKPYQVKDHMNSLPIKNIEFYPSQKLVMSMDAKVIKVWNEDTGKPVIGGLQPGPVLNELCVVPNTGMIFVANEEPKILTYYIPMLGPAPRWSDYLDKLTEELDADYTPSVYDGYKFVTLPELKSLGLVSYIGTSILRAYMHGYIMDANLYKMESRKAGLFSYQKMRQETITETINKRLQEGNVELPKKLPDVNRQIAEAYMHEMDDKKRKNPMTDDRFAEMFSNKNFEVDVESEDYRRVRPSKTTKKSNDLKKVPGSSQSAPEVGDQTSGRRKPFEHLRPATGIVRELRTEEFSETRSQAKIKKLSLEERLAKRSELHTKETAGGNREITFFPSSNTNTKRNFDKIRKHKQERKEFRRPMGNLFKKAK